MSATPESRKSPETTRPASITADRNDAPSRLSGVVERRKRPESQQRLSQYEAIAGVKVRDYAYLPTDPRHYGIATEGSISSGRSDDSDFFNRSDEEDGAYASAERLFESDEDDNNKTSSKAARTSHPAHHHLPKVRTEDVLNVVLPLLAGQLRKYMGDIDLRFSRARALFQFQKATEWEMSIEESEEVYLAHVEPYKPVETVKEAEGSRENKSERDEEPQAEDQGEEEDGNLARTSCTSERWASIDNVADHLLGMVHGVAKPDSKAPAEPVTLQSDPPISEFAMQLNQLLDYAGVYGTGWETALRVKCRGNIPAAAESAKSEESDSTKQAAQQKGKGKLKIRLVDMGLVPGNYIERVDV
ncbi:uncharacterized protein EV422DRAFT_607308 [Fimicolochytrium jonesii]|uniref:uncharacterized protein n=1 Tax=Fimicolochytrium jonesii TaxID=1396493 RepID=UPI0022FE23E9|nr:uncharacterized protein EV422DRAFT_607308 [Fimicolochytrium jonesii]KAI8816830.1 hypothetical protein EV422DRAFT_607308 [Fimicolochytrium jonesii]